MKLPPATATFCILALAACSVPLGAQGPEGTASVAPALTEWTVPWERSRPRDPYVAPDGRVWFVGQAGNYIAVLEPASGRFRRFEIDSGTQPHNLVIDRRGMVWYAGNRNGMIGKLDPATGRITRYPMPDPAVRDPHTLALSPSGQHLWFTAQGAGFVGRLDVSSGRIDIVRPATPRSRPYGITFDSKGRVWFNQFGVNKVATVDPRTLQVREYALPHERARGRRIAVTSDDAVWYVDYTRGQLARLDPGTGRIEEWATPGGPSSLPYAMTVDAEDRLWFVETGRQPNQLVSFDPRTRRFSATPIAKSGGLTVRHMVYHHPTRSLWFGTDANTIARALVPPRVAGAQQVVS